MASAAPAIQTGFVLKDRARSADAMMTATMDYDGVRKVGSSLGTGSMM